MRRVRTTHVHIQCYMQCEGESAKMQAELLNGMKHTRDDSISRCMYLCTFVHVCTRENACVDDSQGACFGSSGWLDASVAYLYVFARASE
jgi:hypothetical protein